MNKRELSPSRMVDELANLIGTAKLTPFQEKFIQDMQQTTEDFTIRDVDYLEQLHHALIGF